MPPSKEPVESQEHDKPGEGKTDQDDAQLEEPKDDVFEEDDGDTSNVSE